MNLRLNDNVGDTPIKVWAKKLSWALPLFFLIKGLAWLAVPFISALYVLN
ncbi:MAG: hypothetical protein KDI63_10805 [Gammaproteobacteria bacterium]|nr:hypothetical protein [Gammaproteobacteria bacterium]